MKFGSELPQKLRRVFMYLCGDYHFANKKLDYTEYWEQLTNKEEWEIILPSKLKFMEGLIAQGSSVLDVGCGDGSLLYHLSQTRGIRGEGIDISEKGVAIAQSRGIEARVADATSGEFSVDRSYDYIIISEVLEHLPNAEEVVLKLRDAFDKRLIITIPNSGFLGERLRLLIGRFPKQWVYHPGEHVRFWTVADFLSWADQLGLRVEAYHGLADDYYDVKVRIWKYYPKLFSRYIVYELSRQTG